jgi:succinate-acetate transporter protein
MKHNIINHQIIQFIVMTIVGVLFNAMNVLAYNISDLYLSLTLFYGGLLMASNMMWAHEIVNYYSMGHFNIKVFSIGIFISIFISIYLLRDQFMINDNNWLKRMISHHSTAITTSENIKMRTKNRKIRELANNIITTQKYEIDLMKRLIN